MERSFWKYEKLWIYVVLEFQMLISMLSGLILVVGYYSLTS